MFVETRDEARSFFLQVWRKLSEGRAMTPLESLVAQIIRAHPEYHDLLARAPLALAHDDGGDDARANPFLHMGLHIALAEQLQTDRPPGILSLFQRLVGQDKDAHEAEHQVMDCLARALSQAARHGRAPDDVAYLACIRQCLA